MACESPEVQGREGSWPTTAVCGHIDQGSLAHRASSVCVEVEKR
jgi:hypothetical protein